ncbi:MAG: HAD family hydrolase [Acidobacteria bacterium]|nr:HAD family hydrolase [Acidobacteriota bacterium]
MPRAKLERQVLLIDADDTLWETNLHFERVVSAFCDLVGFLGYANDYVRQQVDFAERTNIARRGYGAGSFLLTLEEVYLKLAGHRAQQAHRQQIRGFRRVLLEEPLRLFDGVAETLAYLAARHRLLLFSRGDAGEQSRKVVASGLAPRFESWEIVPEKNEAAYRTLVERHGLRPAQVWMVGNSPRFDINPALAAGLNAVFIPAVHSWEYENEEIRPGPPVPTAPSGAEGSGDEGGRLLVLQRFRDLQEHF